MPFLSPRPVSCSLSYHCTWSFLFAKGVIWRVVGQNFLLLFCDPHSSPSGVLKLKLVFRFVLASFRPPRDKEDETPLWTFQASAVCEPHYDFFVGPDLEMPLFLLLVPCGLLQPLRGVLNSLIYAVPVSSSNVEFLTCEFLHVHVGCCPFLINSDRWCLADVDESSLVTSSPRLRLILDRMKSSFGKKKIWARVIVITDDCSLLWRVLPRRQRVFQISRPLIRVLRDSLSRFPVWRLLKTSEWKTKRDKIRYNFIFPTVPTLLTGASKLVAFTWQKYCPLVAWVNVCARKEP